MSETSGHLLRAMMLMNQNRPDMAIEELRRAIALSPDDAEAFCILSSACSLASQYTESEAAARRAIELAPDDWSCHNALASALLFRNKPFQSVKSAKKAVELAPNEATAWQTLASAYLASIDPKQALQAAERGLELDPEDVTLRSTRNIALTRLGGATSVEEARNTLAADPQNELSHAAMANAHLSAGNHRDAIAHYREALRIDPNFEGAREGLLEALKARSWVYRPVLAYTNLIGRMSGKQQLVFWGAFFGSYFLLKRVPTWIPAAAPYTDVARAIIAAVGMLIFFADPLLNCVLRFDKDGRHVLKPFESRWSLVAGVMVLPLTVFWLATALVGGSLWVFLLRITLTVAGAVVILIGIDEQAQRRIGVWLLSVIVVGATVFLVDFFVVRMDLLPYLSKFTTYSLVGMCAVFVWSLVADRE